MNLFERIYALHNILDAARLPVPHSRLEAELECSRATVTRVIRRMRLYFNAPIEYDREHNGYYYAETERPFSPPGLWFSEKEVLALLTLQKLLDEVQPGLLSDTLAPLRRRLEALRGNPGAGGTELNRRVRILSMAARPAGPHFRTVAGALLRRHRLRLRYHDRSRDWSSDRIVSPQRLTYYRDNWYLDAWCHGVHALRVFSLDRIRVAEELDELARDVSEMELDVELASGYGIFAGRPSDTAVLRFTQKRARWIADERWHPEQQSAWLKDGRFELRVPYAQPEELILDILRYGPDVEVAAPPSLRREVRQRLKEAVKQYGKNRERLTN